MPAAGPRVLLKVLLRLLVLLVASVPVVFAPN